jgi:hypothetical protein
VPLPRRALHVCTVCAADTVYPEARVRTVHESWWREARTRWRLWLRCGACGGRREIVVGDARMQRFARRLERARAIMARAVAHSERLRMEAEASALAIALELDLIDAADFGVPRGR